MTNTEICKQGEGSGGRGLAGASRGVEHWTASVLVPAQCLRIEVVVHQDPQSRRYCLAFEVSDPHTKELLAVHVDPAARYSEVMPLASSLVMELRSAVMSLLDPDPF